LERAPTQSIVERHFLNPDMVHFQVEWNEDVQEQIIPNFDGSELHPEDTMLWSKNTWR
jgi:hypothetical protein